MQDLRELQNQIASLQAQNKLYQEQAENERQIRASRPEEYQYTSNLDPTTGLMKSQYTFDPTKSEAYSKLRQEAFSTGPSSWANMLMQKQQAEQAGQADVAQQQQAGAEAGARSSLAMRGGLGGGARSRLASQGMRDLLMARQGISRQGAQQRLGILGQDLQQKQQLMGQVADTELQTQKGNIASSLAERQREEAAKQATYQERMKAWGAEQTARGAEKSKGK